MGLRPRGGIFTLVTRGAVLPRRIHPAIVLLLFFQGASAAALRGDGADPLTPLERLAAAAEANLQTGDLAAAEKRYARKGSSWMVPARCAGWTSALPPRATFEQVAARAGPSRRAASLAGRDPVRRAAPAVDVLARWPRATRRMSIRGCCWQALAAGGEASGRARPRRASAAAASDPEATFRVAEVRLAQEAEPPTALHASWPPGRSQTRVIGHWRDGEYDRARAHLLAALEQDRSVRAPLPGMVFGRRGGGGARSAPSPSSGGAGSIRRTLAGDQLAARC
jgi:hypothetical protein